jgi:hypothetical protein
VPLGTPVAQGSRNAANTGSATELPAGLLKRRFNRPLIWPACAATTARGARGAA